MDGKSASEMCFCVCVFVRLRVCAYVCESSSEVLEAWYCMHTYRRGRFKVLPLNRSLYGLSPPSDICMKKGW